MDLSAHIWITLLGICGVNYTLTVVDMEAYASKSDAMILLKFNLLQFIVAYFILLHGLLELDEEVTSMCWEYLKDLKFLNDCLNNVIQCVEDRQELQELPEDELSCSTR
uniref:Uncharacterized protein n=1 Tax=Glossina austeni TaxID=7395 RepID=A0A1A9UKX5_GLOAU